MKWISGNLRYNLKMCLILMVWIILIHGLMLKVQVIQSILMMVKSICIGQEDIMESKKHLQIQQIKYLILHLVLIIILL